MDGQNYVNLAYHLAVVAHDGQFRKGTGEPYINHVQAVADGVFGWKRKCVALLHDVLEDCPGYTEVLYRLFPGEIFNSVGVLTRNHDDPVQSTYMDYIDYICATGDLDAIYVKLADLDHNMKDTDKLSPEHREFAIRRYTRAKSRIINFLEGALDA